MEHELHIRELLVKEYYGLITEAEQQELDAILAESEEARRMRAAIRSADIDEAKQYLQKVDVSGRLQNAFVQHHARRRRRRIAALLLLGSIATGAYLLLSRHDTTAPATTASIPAHTATLQLADGHVIPLHDSGQQDVSTQQASLQNNNRVLRLNASAGGTSGWNTLTVPTRLDYRIVLEDGTEVWLNSASKIRFPLKFKGPQREVFIEGEAYLSVKEDATRPFIVHAGQTDIRVLGTAFNVNAYTATRVVTSLVQGKVAIRNGSHELTLQPGREAVTATNTPIVERHFDPEATLSWREGIHYFQSATVKEIADIIGRWYDIQVVIDEPAAAKVALRGKLYRHQPLQTFIDYFNATGQVDFYWKEGVLHCR